MSQRGFKNIKCNDKTNSSLIISRLLDFKNSNNLEIICDGKKWIIGKCQNSPSICAGCTSLCHESTNSINIGTYPLVSSSCGYSDGCIQFLFVQFDNSNEFIADFIANEAVVVTSNSILIEITLSGPASVTCSAYLDLYDAINPFSVSDRNVTDSLNITSIMLTR